MSRVIGLTLSFCAVLFVSASHADTAQYFGSSCTTQGYSESGTSNNGSLSPPSLFVDYPNFDPSLGTLNSATRDAWIQSYGVENATVSVTAIEPNFSYEQIEFGFETEITVDEVSVSAITTGCVAPTGATTFTCSINIRV